MLLGIRALSWQTALFTGLKKLADTANQQQREVSRTVFESVRSDSGADAVCRATAEPKPKPERKAAESVESSAQTPQRSAETPKQHHRASAEAARRPKTPKRWASTCAETCTCARGDPELEE